MISVPGSSSFRRTPAREAREVASASRDQRRRGHPRGEEPVGRLDVEPSNRLLEATVSSRRRRRARPAHIGNDSEAEDRAADARPIDQLRGQRRDHARAREQRPVPERDAALPHPRARRGLLAPLAAGGSVICPPDFDAAHFLDWVESARTDVVHGRADDAPGDPRSASGSEPSPIHHSLRFVRSSSARSPVPV